jgi:hypothetical protein
MAGMLASLAVMNVIYWPANVPALHDWWHRTVGVEIFWPLFTLIGTLVTLATAAITRGLWPETDAASAARRAG